MNSQPPGSALRLLALLLGFLSGLFWLPAQALRRITDASARLVYFFFFFQGIEEKKNCEIRSKAGSWKGENLFMQFNRLHVRVFSITVTAAWFFKVLCFAKLTHVS